MFEENDDWRKRALCARMVAEGLAHPNWWDSRLDSGSDDDQEKTKDRNERHEKAKAVCRQCRVQLQCKVDTRPGVDEGVRFGLVLTELPSAGRRAA